MKKKSTTRAARGEKASRFVPHSHDAHEARLSAESAKRDEFLSAEDSAAIVADWLGERILRGALEGEVLKEIASRHDVSANTLKKQIRSLLRKTGDESLSGAAVRLLRETCNTSQQSVGETFGGNEESEVPSRAVAKVGSGGRQYKLASSVA